MRMTGHDFTRIFEEMREAQDWWAAQLGVSQPSIFYLLKRQDKPLPYKHAARIENLYARFQGLSAQTQTDTLRREIVTCSEGCDLIDRLLAWLPETYMAARAELLLVSRDVTAQRVMAETRLAELKQVNE